MAMPQRDETIEEIKRLDALLEYACAMAVGTGTGIWCRRTTKE